MNIPEAPDFITGFVDDDPKRPIYADFIAAPDLKAIGDRLIAGRLSTLDDGVMAIDYRWKRSGGTSGGNMIMGKCVKLSGVAKHYAAGAHFMIWLAADHCEVEGYDDHQIEALTYHELLHIEREEYENKDGETVVKYRTRGHDVELFYEDLRAYGAWSRNRERLVEVVHQLPLPLGEVAVSGSAPGDLKQALGNELRSMGYDVTTNVPIEIPAQ